MPRLKYPNVSHGPASPSNGIDRVDFFNLVGRETTPEIEVALLDIFAGFNREDFGNARLGSRLYDHYDSADGLYGRKAEFAVAAYALRPTAAFIIKASQFSKSSGNVIGQVSFANYRSDSIGKILHFNHRQFTGWFDKKRIHPSVSAVEMASLVVEGGIKIAGEAGLSKIQVQVAEEEAAKDPNLVVVEHTADLASLGFKEVPSTKTNIEDETFEGVIWSRKVST
jgi:hypothetical protein